MSGIREKNLAGTHFLRWQGPILDASGYAAAGRGYLAACESVGSIRVQARDRSRSVNLKGRGMDEEILAMYTRLEANEVPTDTPCVQHQVADCFFKNPKTRYSIGYTIFEMDSIPPLWATYCNDMDVIWTGSEYSRKAFLAGGTKVPVRVLPHALNLDRFSPAAEPWKIKNRRSFAFISVFDFTERKAWRELLRAYWTAFKPSDDVCLILKVFHGGFSEDAQKDVLRRIVSYKRDLLLGATPPLLIYGHDIAMKDMPGLYRAADCYVSISREGFGLPYAEAMACGLACIGPEVGGTREFMSPENSFLVRYEGDEPISAEMARINPLFVGLSWAKHSWEHLAQVMKQVAFDRELRLEKAKLGMQDVRAKHSYQVIGNRILNLLPSQ